MFKVDGQAPRRAVQCLPTSSLIHPRRDGSTLTEGQSCRQLRNRIESNLHLKITTQVKPYKQAQKHTATGQQGNTNTTCAVHQFRRPQQNTGKTTNAETLTEDRHLGLLFLRDLCRGNVRKARQVDSNGKDRLWHIRTDHTTVPYE